MTSNSGNLNHLAHLYGVQTAYYDVNHKRTVAPEDSLLAVLSSLGAPVENRKDIIPALRGKQQELWQRVMEPVTVVWDNRDPIVDIRIPANLDTAMLSLYLGLESGIEKKWNVLSGDIPVVDSRRIEGRDFLVKRLSLAKNIPWGYHTLTLAMKDRHFQTLLISAPSKAYMPPDADKHQWGGFLPLYALHSRRSWGGGNYTDLEYLGEYLASEGGNLISTLPLFPTFFNELQDLSPYLPVSRLFWNEFYLDIEKIDELQVCTSARRIMESTAFQKELEALRKSDLVDYQREMSLKRLVLDKLCDFLFSHPSSRLAELHSFEDKNPGVVDYAKFRAAGEKLGISWKTWPKSIRDGSIQNGDYSTDIYRYYLYTQWLTMQQTQRIFNRIRDKGVELYLDMPLGAHPDGYDVWHEKESFTNEVTAGAPPDAVFKKGQNWAFPPLHPQGIRDSGYRYYIASIRHSLQYAGVLRIDHVMSLHRLFFIPHGQKACQGVYVRYHSDEMYAILTLESHRHRSVLVGEDLGTVPSYVRKEMDRHRLYRMYVLYYELNCGSRDLPNPPPRSIASLNTHDMPPFAAMWPKVVQNKGNSGHANLKNSGSSIKGDTAVDGERLTDLLIKKGWLNKEDIDPISILKASLSFLAASRSPVLLINLEDLWLETRPQNIPASGDDYLNWQNKTRYNLEELKKMPVLDGIMSMVSNIREGREI